MFPSTRLHSTYSGRPYLLNRLRYDVPSVTASIKGDWRPFHADGTPMSLPPTFDGSGIESISVYVVQMAIKLRKIYDSM